MFYNFFPEKTQVSPGTGPKIPEEMEKKTSNQTISHTMDMQGKSNRCSLNCGLSHCHKSKSESQLMITEQTEEFWRRHFDARPRVDWTEFRVAFLNDYGKQLREFSRERFYWILNILHVEVFGGSDVTDKNDYDRFCGHSTDPDRFWLKVKEYAIDRIFKEGVAESLFG